jgi:peptidoglycan hydrolase CwlO-like protein
MMGVAGLTLAGVLSFAFFLGSLHARASDSADKTDRLYSVVAVDKDSLQSRVSVIENKIVSIESRLNSIESRLDSIESRLNSIESRLNSMEADLKELKELVRSRVRTSSSVKSIRRPIARSH